MGYYRNKIIYALMLLIAGGALIVYAQDPIPQSVVHQVPFTTQAPNNNWDDNKDCEEASIIMARAFLEGNKAQDLPAGQVVREISELKTWEQEFLGHNRDTGAYDTVRIANEAAGLNARVIQDYSVDDLKKILAGGEVILLPIDASRLGNAKYPANVAFYHMVIITGYDGNNFFVNDPGTDTGRENIYSFDILKQASTDWNHEARAMDFNNKVAVVVSK